MKHNNLYPCNCGGIARAHEDYTGGWQVQCKKCGLMTMSYSYQEIAETVWNDLMKRNEAVK